MGVAKTLNERIFRQIHGNTLIYNTCWEDPRCDREMLKLDKDSRVVMLTSAGCNALDYLLDNPKEIHCVDLNPRQNALLQLKAACFKSSDHSLLFELFGNGASPRARQAFDAQLRPHLSGNAVKYWQKNIAYFNGQGLRKSFYWRGSSGAVAWMVRRWLLRKPETRKIANQLFAAKNKAEQKHWYEQFEPRFLNPFVRWFLRQHLVQSMLGVPKSQQKMATSLYQDGMTGYIRSCLRHVFTELPLQDNYFWRLYYYGKYEQDCCPNYLVEENFDTLKGRIEQVQTYTLSLSDFLKKNPGKYTHFILLDHQDWLAANLKDALIEEWQLILQNAAPGAKVLLRSASHQHDFLPEFVLDAVEFDEEAAKISAQNDRVGTYAGTFFGEIKSG